MKKRGGRAASLSLAVFIVDAVVDRDEHRAQEGRIPPVVSDVQPVGVAPSEPFLRNSAHHPAVKGDGKIHTKNAAVDFKMPVAALHGKAVPEQGKTLADRGDQDAAAV